MNSKLFNGIYNGKKVFVTGHTGFKGSWLVYWLEQMGATVAGYALAPQDPRDHINQLKTKIVSTIADIRNLEKLTKAMNDFSPDIVFHLAAQPLVRLSYEMPLETFETNIMGSLNLYHAVSKTPSVKAVVSITTDKVYENNEWVWGYRENDRLGGKDPYSASKAAMEIVTSSYRHSFFNLDKYKVDHNVLLATVRAGNVVGGGDFSKDRLIPDIVKAVAKGEKVIIRNPHATRPWQHVLEPLSGYLLVGQKLLEGKKEFADSFNFGPLLHEEFPVIEIVKRIKAVWESVDFEIHTPKNAPHEATLLMLDCSKALKTLNWKPVWTTEVCIERTVNWYRSLVCDNKVTTEDDFKLYLENASTQAASWSSSNS